MSSVPAHPGAEGRRPPLPAFLPPPLAVRDCPQRHEARDRPPRRDRPAWRAGYVFEGVLLGVVVWLVAVVLTLCTAPVLMAAAMVANVPAAPDSAAPWAAVLVAWAVVLAVTTVRQEMTGRSRDGQARIEVVAGLAAALVPWSALLGLAIADAML